MVKLVTIFGIKLVTNPVDTARIILFNLIPQVVYTPIIDSTTVEFKCNMSDMDLDNKIISTLALDELPGMSASEVSAILSNIQKHSQSEKHYMVEENDHDGFCDVDILMDETINHKYTFTIQLHMERNNNSGVMYYKGFEADCTSNQFEWYIKGFSFAWVYKRQV